MGYVLIAIVAIFSGTFAYVFDNTAEFNTWTEKCNRAGGQISQTHEGFTSTRYECFVKGKMVTLPGYEGK